MIAFCASAKSSSLRICRANALPQLLRVQNRLFTAPTRPLFSSLKTLGKAVEEEIKYEKEYEGFSADVPSSVMELLPKDFKLVDKKERNDVLLKSLKDKLTIQFSIIPTENSGEDFEHEGANEEDEDMEDSEVIPMTVECVRNGVKMSAFCSVSYEGDVVVNDVEVSSDVSMSDTAETEYKRRYEYNPKYYQLDEQLQESIEDFIDEKIKDVGEFIVQYAEWKENSEYVSWLEKLKEFSK